MRAQSRLPNVILILADDLGYGDIGCYGSRIPTPNLDRMAAEGMRFTHHYAAASVCSPSRAGLLTGRYPTRVGVPSVLFPSDTGGLAGDETTIARMLKGRGYTTMCIGKWHLGSRPGYLPTDHGFDEFFGLLYSNDMSPLPLLYNSGVVEETARLEMLTRRYTDQAVNFIGRSKDQPFFLYLPHTYPHIPLAPSTRFQGKSALGSYGDAVEELDWSVGEILRALQETGLDDNTLVMFTSDNGPWFQGNPGMLRGRKGQTYEGGVRVPFIARFPGRIPADRVCRGVASAMDVLPTVARLVDAPLPEKPLDGVDIWPLMADERKYVQREALLYFDGWQIQCARYQRWKLWVSRSNAVAWAPDPVGGRYNLPLPRPELYDLNFDPQEGYDVAAEHPDVVADIRQRIERLVPTFPNQVQAHWLDTMRRQVLETPPGALPVPKP